MCSGVSRKESLMYILNKYKKDSIDFMSLLNKLMRTQTSIWIKRDES